VPLLIPENPTLYANDGWDDYLVLIDEADGMTNPAQLALLSKLDATAFPPTTIFVFTCNGTDGLEPKFISRCRTVEFSSYRMAAEIIAFLEYVWHSEGWKEDRVINFNLCGGDRTHFLNAFRAQ